MDWLRQVLNAKSCQCSKSSVRVSLLEIYRNMMKSPFKKHPAFIEFQEKLFKEVETEES
jgi:hypothetical protein